MLPCAWPPVSSSTLSCGVTMLLTWAVSLVKGQAQLHAGLLSRTALDNYCIGSVQLSWGRSTQGRRWDSVEMWSISGRTCCPCLVGMENLQ